MFQLKFQTSTLLQTWCNHNTYEPNEKNKQTKNKNADTEQVDERENSIGTRGGLI